jgi:hypothetical protein
MSRRQTSLAYQQAPDVEPAAAQSANCDACGSVLEFGTNGHGVLIERCPHCHDGKPLRVKPVHIRRCERCTKPLDERESDLCRRCIPLTQTFNICANCGAKCHQTRCGPCRRLYERNIQRERESERRRRLRDYWASTRATGEGGR